MFDDLKRERERLEAAELALREEKAERERLEKLPQVNRSNAVSDCDGMVIGVLEILREAAYPELIIERSVPDLNSWALGSWHSFETLNDSFGIKVSITLLFGRDNGDVPSGFRCGRLVKHQSSAYMYYSYCGLTEFELVQTLKELHPIGEPQKDAEIRIKKAVDKYDHLVSSAIRRLEFKDYLSIKFERGPAPIKIRCRDFEQSQSKYGYAWQYWGITDMQNRSSIDVKVALEFDSHGNPKGFYCVRDAGWKISEYDQNRIIHVHLSESELANALKRLLYLHWKQT